MKYFLTIFLLCSQILLLTAFGTMNHYSIRYTVNRKDKIKNVYVYQLGCVVINKKLKEFKEYVPVIRESIAKKYKIQDGCKKGEYIIKVDPVYDVNNNVVSYELLGLY